MSLTTLSAIYLDKIVTPPFRVRAVQHVDGCEISFEFHTAADLRKSVCLKTILEQHRRQLRRRATERADKIDSSFQELT